MSCQESDKYLLLENITPVPNGDYSSNSHVMMGSCKGTLDLYMGHVNRPRAKYFKHMVWDQGTGRPHAFQYTRGSSDENKVLAGTGGGRGNRDRVISRHISYLKYPSVRYILSHVP